MGASVQKFLVGLVALSLSASASAQSPFRHEIVLNLPKGAAGLKPNLSLVYQPGPANGTLGVGWSLQGLTTISRVNYGNGITCTSEDTFAHSQLGVLLKQSDGTYRSKAESFVRLVARGSCGSGPCSWEATDRSGTQYYYGASSDGSSVDSQLACQDGTVLAWGLKQVKDLFGNSYDVTYVGNIAKASQLYPSVITYTRGLGVTKLRTVEFAYDWSRQDPELDFSAPAGPRWLSGRITSISVKAGGALLRSYQLGYGVSPLTNRSTLGSVRECGRDGSCYPAQTFDWAGHPLDQYVTRTYGSFIRGDSTHTVAGDFNGDGKAEIVVGTGSTLRVHSAYDGTFLWAYSGANIRESIMVADVNGDGKSDVLTVSSTALDIYYSTGNGFIRAANISVPSASGSPVIGDFDGDGKMEIATFSGDYVYVTRPDTWVQTVWAGNYAGNRLLGDFDGDGRQDIAVIDGPNGKVYVYQKFGTTNKACAAWSIASVDSSTAAFSYAGDFNGDGVTDLAIAAGERIRLDLSTRHGFDQRTVTVPNHWSTDPANVWAVDFNRDGKGDLATVVNGSLYVNVSTGTSFVQQERAYGASCNQASAYTWVGDRTGNGYLDVFSATPSAICAHERVPSASPLVFQPVEDGVAVTREVPNADLVYGVHNSIGGATWIVYGSAAVAPYSSLSPDPAHAIEPLASGGSSYPLPTTDPIVFDVGSSDGRATYWVSYMYGDRRFRGGALRDRRDLGFRWVRTTDSQTRVSTVTYYRQDPKYEGLIDHSETYAYGGGTYKLMGRLTRTYVDGDTRDCVSALGSRTTDLVFPSVETVERWEFGGSNDTPYSKKGTWTTYDRCGNAVTAKEFAPGLPDVVTTTDHSTDTARWILGRAFRVTVQSGTKLLSQTLYDWTGDALTSKRRWLDTDQSFLAVEMTYDANGNLYSVTDPNDASSITYTEYDSSYRAYPSRTWKVTTTSQRPPTLTQYNDDGQVVAATDENNVTTLTEYDWLWRKTRETRPDGGVTTYAYLYPPSQAGSLAATVSNGSLASTSFQRNRTSTLVEGNRWMVTDEYFDGAGSVYRTETTGDNGSLVCKTSLKDSAGRPWKASLPCYCGATPAYSVTGYEAAGRVSSVTAPDNRVTSYAYGPGSTTIVDAHGLRTTRHVDARDHVTAVVDTLAQTATYGYDEAGRLISIALPDGTRSFVTYDSLGRRTSVTAPQGGGPNLRYTYDDLGRKTAVYALGSTEPRSTYTYDEASVQNGIGRLTRIVDPSGTTTTSYDAMGRPKVQSKVIDGRTYTYQFTYDYLGRARTLVYPDGSRVEYTYTDGGHVDQVLFQGALLVRYADYTADGQARSATFGNNATSRFDFDVVGRLSSVVTQSQGRTLQDLSYNWGAYSYVNASGVTVNGNMDGMAIGAIIDNRPNKLVTQGGASVNTDETQYYEYDAAYRLTKAVGAWGYRSYHSTSTGNLDQVGGVVQRTLSYSGQQVVSGTGVSDVRYDDAGNMVHKVMDGVAWDYGWNPEGQLASASSGTVSAQMTYDTLGERVKKVYSAPDGTVVTTTYAGEFYERRSYSNGSPERHTVHVAVNGQLIVSVTRVGAVVTAFNDRNGWRTELAAASIYDAGSLAGGAAKLFHLARAMLAHPMAIPLVVWSVFALLLAAVGWGLVSAHLKARQGWRSDWSALTRVAAAASVLVFFVSGCTAGPDGSSALQDIHVSKVLQGGTTFGPQEGTVYYHRNYVNSSTVLTDGTGAEVSRIVYFPFGEVSQANSVGNDVATSKFTGKELDEEFGLYYYGARYYDPALGRFISADTSIPDAGDVQAFNRYTYCRNNPILYVDPTGHSWFSRLGKWIGKHWKAIVAIQVIIAVVALAIVASVLSWGTAAPLAAAAVGAVIGGLSGAIAGAASGGDWEGGLLVGGIVGAAAGYAGWYAGAAAGSAVGGGSGAWSGLASGAASGAVNGFGQGIIAGYQGGKGSFGEIVRYAFTGALIGAVVGGGMGYLTSAGPPQVKPGATPQPGAPPAEPPPLSPTAHAHPGAGAAATSRAGTAGDLLRAGAKVIINNFPNEANTAISAGWSAGAQVVSSELVRYGVQQATTAVTMDLVAAGVIRIEDLFSYQEIKGKF